MRLSAESRYAAPFVWFVSFVVPLNIFFVSFARFCG